MNRALMNFWYRFGTPPWVMGPRTDLVRLVSEGRLRPGRALDLGCGEGDNAIFLAEQGFQVTGVDFARAALAKADAKARRAGVQLTLVERDLTRPLDLPAPFELLVDYGTFDVLAYAAAVAIAARALDERALRLALLYPWYVTAIAISGAALPGWPAAARGSSQPRRRRARRGYASFILVRQGAYDRAVRPPARRLPVSRRGLRPFALACFLTSAGCAGDIAPEEAGGGAGGTTGSAGAQGGGGLSGSQGAAGGPGGGARTSANPTGGAAGVSGVSGTLGSGGGAGAGSGGRAGTGGTGGVGGIAGGAGIGGAGGRGGATTGSGGSGGASTGGTGGGAPATFKVFDRIPQYGMYATRNPNNYTPPADVLMWSYGAYFVAKLSPAQRAAIGGDLTARITYHAQCDNYDRLGTLFFVLAPPGQPPKTTDPRTELARFITPFSDYTQGTLATYVFPNADISAYAATLASVEQDVWIGIGGGSNPYNGDPCTNANVTPEFRDVGFKYSLELVSTKPLPAGAGTTLTALNYFQATKVPVTGTLNNPGGELAGRVTVIVSGHGSEAGGDEYRYTQDTLSVGGMQLGSFSTQTNCASYEKYSPDGNPGIFRNNTSSNPRNWCPGALVPAHTFPVTLRSGSNAVSLAMSNAQLPSGSYYATSISFTAP